MVTKQVYEKPALRRVHLDVKTAVLGTCNLSTGAEMLPGCAIEGASCIYP